MWEIASEYISERPIFGYGFGAGGELVGARYYGVATVHSGIYETLLGTGIIGLFLLSMQIIYVIHLLLKNIILEGFRNNIADILIVIYFVIRTVTSLGIGNWHSQELMIWLVFFFSIRKGKSMHMNYLAEG